MVSGWVMVGSGLVGWMVLTEPLPVVIRNRICDRSGDRFAFWIAGRRLHLVVAGLGVVSHTPSPRLRSGLSEVVFTRNTEAPADTVPGSAMAPVAAVSRDTRPAAASRDRRVRIVINSFMQRPVRT